jgi:hypothetical protein
MNYYDFELTGLSSRADSDECEHVRIGAYRPDLLAH